MVVASGQIHVIVRDTQVRLTATESVDYVLAGDFEESPIIGTLDDTDTLDITLTT